MRTEIHWPMIGALVLIAAACSPKPAEAPSAPAPSETMKASFPDCTWGEQTGAGLTINAFSCPNQKLVADEALPGFQMQQTETNGAQSLYPTIRVFTKAVDAPVDAVLDAVRAASPGPFTAECALTPSPNDPSGKTFQFVPTGAGKAAHEAFIAGASEDNSMPCGPMGPSEAGDRIFQQVSGAPDKVVYVNLGSDIQIFDIYTLRAAK